MITRLVRQTSAGRWSMLAALMATLAALGARPATLRAQAPSTLPASRPAPKGGSYPISPTPVLSPRSLSVGPAVSGYLSVREARRNDSTVFSVNRARLGVQGLPHPSIAYRLQADFSSAGRIQRDSSVPAIVLTDAYVQLHRAPPATRADSASLLTALAPALLVGQFKLPFSLEYLTSFSLLKTANRSNAVDRLSPKRDIGAMGQLSLTRFATVMGALVNGEGSNQPRNPDNTELSAGRFVLRPLPALTLAGKWAGGGPDHYWGYDARWLWRGLTLEGEAIRRTGRTPGSTAAAPPTPRYDASGGYALLAWRALPWLEPVVKWEQFEERTSATARPSETWVTPGVVLQGLDDRARLQVNWIVKRTHPVERQANELQAQLIAIF